MRRFASLIFIATLAWPAAGQTEPTPEAAPQGQESAQPKEAPGEAPQAQRGGRDADAGETRDALSGQVRRIKAELRLTDEQSAQFDDLLRRHRAEPRPRDVARVLDEVRRARESGNSDEMNAAIEQLRAITQPSALAVFDELEPLLTEEQLPRLQRVRQRMSMNRRLSPTLLLESLAWLRAELRLNESQRQSYDQMALATADALDPTARTRDMDEAAVQEIIAELQQAIAENDEDRIHEVRSRFSPRQESPYDALLRTIVDVDALLEGGQRRELVEYIESIPDLSERMRETRDPLRYIKAARRLDLPPERDQQLDALEEQAAQVDRGNAAVRARQTYQIVTRLFDVLTPAEHERFAELFEAQAEPRGREGAPTMRLGGAPGAKQPGEPGAKQPEPAGQGAGEP